MIVKNPARITAGILAAGAALALALACPAESTEAPEKPAAAPAKPPSIEPADNSFCFVCHRNFENEPLSAKHAKIGVGCEQCHGISEKHSADEDGITPPEIMYAKARINPSCIKCHPEEKIKKTEKHKLSLARTKELIKPGQEKLPEIKTGDAGEKWICTDCHGQHRMKVRTRTWDKATGKLIKDDGVRMMDKSRPVK